MRNSYVHLPDERSDRSIRICKACVYNEHKAPKLLLRGDAPNFYSGEHESNLTLLTRMVYREEVVRPCTVGVERQAWMPLV
jgi:hypothetical protein